MFVHAVIYFIFRMKFKLPPFRYFL